MTRAEFMTPTQKAAMGRLSRTHRNCLEKTNVMRPGKTACERARRAGKPQ